MNTRPEPPPAELAVDDYRTREASTGICICSVTLIASVALNLGAPAASVVIWPMLSFQLLSLWHSWMEWRARKRRKALQEGSRQP